MQTLSWYMRRLRAMGPREIAWRTYSAARGVADRCLVSARRRPLSLDALLERSEEGRNALDEPGFRVSEAAPGDLAAAAAGDPRARARLSRLLARAGRIAEHRLTFFDLEDRDLGTPIDWNRDPKSGVAAPMRYAPSIDYRDFRETGDCKFVWEPNRHHHLVVLGRAYRASGDERYARALIEQMDSWIDACPFGIGMNWRSPLELAIRVINWAFAIDLIRESGLCAGAFRARLLNSVHRHLWMIDRSYSRGSSANNHTIGEAAGVFIGASYFSSLKQARRWRARAKAILAGEAARQTYGDGVNREQALSYHLFVAQFLLVSGVVARRTGDDLPPAFWETLERKLSFLAALLEGGNDLPMYGDCDDGYVLDLGDEPAMDARGLLAAGAAVFGRADLKEAAGGYVEWAEGLLGREGRAAFESAGRHAPPPTLASRAFSDAGLYLLQSGRRASADRVSVLFDCGELGMGSIAAHGHADALSFILRAFGVDILVDPGTYDYFTFPEWRAYFRSTGAHNTLVVDGADQSVMLGPFLWGERAAARCLSWEPAPEGGGRVSGEHDGYARLSDPVIHRRALSLDPSARTLLVEDEVATGGRHDVALFFHASERCAVTLREGNRVEVDAGPGAVTLVLDPALSVELVRARESPIGGWVSRGYHRRAPATAVVARASIEGTARFTTRVLIGAPREQAGAAGASPPGPPGGPA